MSKFLWNWGKVFTFKTLLVEKTWKNMKTKRPWVKKTCFFPSTKPGPFWVPFCCPHMKQEFGHTEKPPKESHRNRLIVSAVAWRSQKSCRFSSFGPKTRENSYSWRLGWGAVGGLELGRWKGTKRPKWLIGQMATGYPQKKPKIDPAWVKGKIDPATCGPAWGFSFWSIARWTKYSLIFGNKNFWRALRFL